MKTILRRMGEAGIPYSDITSASPASVAASADHLPGVAALRRDGRARNPDTQRHVWNMIYDEHAPEGVLPVISHDELWRRLERFLEEVLSVAEASGVQLAAHPDDPPMPFMRQSRGWFISLVFTSASSILTPAPATSSSSALVHWARWREMTSTRRLSPTAGSKAGYVHFRNVAGRVPQYRETFIDDGEIDMIRVLSILHRNGFDGVLIPDHTPQITCDAPWHAGMAHALGIYAGGSDEHRASVRR